METKMKRKTSRFIVLILLAFQFSGLQAQVTVPAAGGSAQGSGGSASYTIGQVFYTTNTGTGGSVAQGVQQPYEISVLTGILEASGINLSCFPNPATDFVTLKVENYNTKNLWYRLFDARGSLLESKKITGDETGIPMGSLGIATYYIVVIENSKEIKSFKIIKN